MSTMLRELKPRAEELLVDQATIGLQEQQRRELADLLRDDAAMLQDEFMRTAALVQLGIHSLSKPATAGMPERLRSRLIAEASGHVQAATPAKVVTIGNRRGAKGNSNKPKQTVWQNPYLGWAAAAVLAIALLIVRTDFGPGSAREQRADLLTAAGDTATTPWNVSEFVEYAGVTGDVVWSDEQQRGYMRLAGMPANDLQSQQYQLWIVDPERSAQPVDGGVFDIPAGGQEVIVPITAKLEVDQPVAFAITLEKRGGVVVSAGPLLLVASAGG